MTISTRPVSPDDAPIVGKLVSALFNELKGVALSDAKELDLGVVERVLAFNPRTCGFLLLEDGVAIGVLMLSEGCALYARGLYGVITELYITPDKRSGGRAKMLIECAEQLAKERHWSMLEVGAPSQPLWQRSFEFYMNNGFHEVGPRLRKRL